MAPKKPHPELQPAIDQWFDSRELHNLVEEQFPSLVPMMTSGTNRRKFLQLMGASLALAGVTGCRWPKEPILPYTKTPEGRTPGSPVQYATAMELAGAACGLLITSYDGRPIKVEGNPSHPSSRGASNSWQQASLLELYDPDRSQQLLQESGSSREVRNWDEFHNFATQHFSSLRQTEGARLAILCESTSSPSVADMKARLLKSFPKAVWYEHEPISRDAEREGTGLAFGKPFRAQLQLDNAKRIVSLDSDFLMTHPDSLKYASDFASRRRGDNNELIRLVAFEANLTVTGAMADNRYPVRSELVSLIARELYEAIGQRLEIQTNPIDPPESAELSQLRDALQELADDLLAHLGGSVIVAGHHQPAEVHALAAAMNVMLGNVGQTITYAQQPDADRPTHATAITALTERMNNGDVETLVILGGNPVETTSSSLDFEVALGKVPFSIHLSQYFDETSRACKWHVPRAHYLESWCDARAYDGTFSVVQPLIEPLYGGKTSSELLALIVGDGVTSAYEIAKRTFAGEFSGQSNANIDLLWRQSLYDGVVADSAWPKVTPSLQPFELSKLQNNDSKTEQGFEICLVEDYSVFDGRFANNAWLQEWPDPISKLTWDNAALLSPADAEKIGVKKQGDMIRISVDSVSLEIAAFPLPGHAQGSITIPLGYGRDSAGVIAQGAGVRASLLQPIDGRTRIASAEVTATGGRYKLATSQDKTEMNSRVGKEESARRVADGLMRVATIGEYTQNPEFAKHDAHQFPLWKDWSYEDGHKWGLAIDLSACIGCNGCVVACQAENNIPVVGKDEVATGRIMHWLRVDRYFQETATGSSHSDPDANQPAENHEGEQNTAPEMTPVALTAIQHAAATSLRILHQPMTCHQCENAPCEQVCPVAATVHDKEGLSVMVYSRCIGTRYCNNNCPFRVRRFNWFWNHHGPSHPRKGEDLTEVEKMVNNPNVTVRSRGVMEKCAFCSQRINAAKIQARNEGWDRIPDGHITPACAQACPTSAIVFGDLNDPDSRVRKMHGDVRAYELLPELNLKSRLLYLAKLTNPAEATKPQRADAQPPATEKEQPPAEHLG